MSVNFNNFFKPKRIVVIGASRNPRKVGHVIVKSIVDGGFEGEVIPVNKKADRILGKVSYRTVLDIPGDVDLGIISVPAPYVLNVVKECNKKGIKDILIVTAGFSEIGEKELEDALRNYVNKYKMRCIGVNCLGVYDAHNNLDTLFLPRYKLERPRAGGISFICQSGAVGSATLDLVASQGHKFAKFISYGNATQIDESDILEYLGQDEDTKVICMYIEGIKDGDKFFEIAKRVAKRKPVVVLKGGLSERGEKATMSHTGSLAGAKEVYFGVFKQAGLIRVDSLDEMFNIASMIGKGINLKGNRTHIITNGGGYGILTTDAVVDSKNLEMSEFSEKTAGDLRKKFSKNVNIANPLDLVADANTENYKTAIEACISDNNIDIIVVIVLYQTPMVGADVVEVISEARRKTDKPIVAVSTGGDFTKNLSMSLSETGVPVFGFPKDSIEAVDKLMWYELKKKKL
jgi:acetate---CoA ligase (ADP-forming)